MIRKPKRPLFSFFVFLAVTLSVPLLGFFILASVLDPAIFLPLGAGLLCCLIALVILNRRLINRKSDIQMEIQDYAERANLLEDEIHKERAAIQAFRDKIVNFSQLKGLTERLSMCLTLEDTSKVFSEEVSRLFGDQETTIILYLFHSKTGELGISSSQKGQMSVNIKSHKGDAYDQWIVKTMQPLVVIDTRNDYRFDADQIETRETRGIGSLIGVPLVVGSKALGILRIDNPVENHFKTEDLRLLTTIADLGAVAIENAQLYERVEQLASKDGLTGLFLKRTLLERLPEEIARQVSRGGTLAFLMIDLDHFKHYNDVYGHMAGDIVLGMVSGLLKELFDGPGMLVCRYGGEEFAVVISDCPRAKAVAAAEEFRKRVSEQIVFLRREKTRVRVSIGVGVFPEDAQDVKGLIHKADLALYRAKEAGRDRVCSAS